MNKLYISVAVAFISGIAAGAAGAWAYAHKKAQEDFDAKLDSVRKEYKRYYIEKSEEPENSKEDDSVNAPAETEEVVENYVSIASTYSNPIDYTSYTPVASTPPKSDSDAEKEMADILKEDDPTRPRIIPEDEYYYYSEDETTTKLDIWLFKSEDGDLVLTDETFDPLDEPYKVITKEDLEEFSSQEEMDETYTVCESRDCVYSICKQQMSWEEFLRTHPVILDTRY